MMMWERATGEVLRERGDISSGDFRKNCRVGLTVVLHDYQEYDCL